MQEIELPTNMSLFNILTVITTTKIINGAIHLLSCVRCPLLKGLRVFFVFVCLFVLFVCLFFFFVIYGISMDGFLSQTQGGQFAKLGALKHPICSELGEFCGNLVY